MEDGKDEEDGHVRATQNVLKEWRPAQRFVKRNEDFIYELVASTWCGRRASEIMMLMHLHRLLHRLASQSGVSHHHKPNKHKPNKQRGTKSFEAVGHEPSCCRENLKRGGHVSARLMMVALRQSIVPNRHGQARCLDS